MTIQRNHKSRHPQKRCGSSAGSSHSWRSGGPDHGRNSAHRFAYPQYGGGFARLVWDPTRRGPVNMAMLARPTGSGGSTSKPNPIPPSGSDGGKGQQGTKRA